MTITDIISGLALAATIFVTMLLGIPWIGPSIERAGDWYARYIDWVDQHKRRP
jgi:hypothetical protein